MFSRAASVAVLALFALPFAVGCAGAAGSSSEDDSADIETTHQAVTLAKIPSAASIVDGNVDATGNASFVLDRGSKFPIIFTVSGSAVANITNGFEIKGDVTLATPVGSLDLANADISLVRSSGGGIDTLTGSVSFMMPNLGALQGITANAPLQAQISYETGASLTASGISAPILADRKYIALDYSVGLSAQAGPVSISLGNSKAGTLVVDPSDPSFFMTGSILGLDQVGPLQDVSFGMSARGLLQFTPTTTYGLDGDAANGFTGHLYAKGTVALKRIPLSFDGEMVVNLDPNGHGRTIGSGTPDGVEIGVNGAVNLNMDVKALNFNLPLATASVFAKITSDTQRGWISGDAGPKTDWMPSVLPLIPSAHAKFAAYVDSNVDASYVQAETDISLNANKFFQQIPQMQSLGLHDLQIAQGTFRADSDGVRVTGTMTMPTLPVIKAKGQLSAVAVLPANDPTAASIKMNGDLYVGDLALGTANMSMDKSGFTVGGTFTTPVSSMSLNGAVTSCGATLDGRMQIELTGNSTAIQDVACGEQFVIDAGKCGATYTQDAAYCGESYVSSGAECGWDTVSSCILSGFSDCHTAKSCSIANSCNVPNGCFIPKTCAQAVTTANFDFGTLKGNLHVAVTGGKATASVSGQICKGSTCVPVGSATVTLGSNPQVCVSGLDGATGDICASF